MAWQSWRSRATRTSKCASTTSRTPWMRSPGLPASSARPSAARWAPLINACIRKVSCLLCHHLYRHHCSEGFRAVPDDLLCSVHAGWQGMCRLCSLLGVPYGTGYCLRTQPFCAGVLSGHGRSWASCCWMPGTSQRPGMACWAWDATSLASLPRLSIPDLDPWNLP